MRPHVSRRWVMSLFRFLMLSSYTTTLSLVEHCELPSGVWCGAGTGWVVINVTHGQWTTFKGLSCPKKWSSSVTIVVSLRSDVFSQ